MKWSLQQLRKLTWSPYSFNLSFDFTEDIKDIEDIIEISEVKVDGTITSIDNDTFDFTYHIQTTLVLACALTLEPVEYQLDLVTNESYGLTESEEVTLIDNNTVDLRAMVWTTILINKPIRVIHDDAYQILSERKVSLIDDIPDDEE